MIRIGLVGFGYWGPNISRAAEGTGVLSVEMIADAQPAALDRAARRHPAARMTADWRALVADPKVDAVMIATPVHTHFEIAMAALKAGKHVFVEKPMTDSPATAAILVDEALRRRRVLMVGIGRRHNTLAFFETVGSALLRRQRLAIRYFARGRGEEGEREVSPQRLVHYRDNWYLDAWCHLRGDLRSFAIDSIREARALEQPALDVPQADIDTALGAGYGIFGGQDIHWATLRFSPERARWVAAEHWHPEQRGHTGADGYYILEIPYSDHRELLMDILKHGVHCEVLGPDVLRGIVRDELRQMHEKYVQVA